MTEFMHISFEDINRSASMKKISQSTFKTLKEYGMLRTKRRNNHICLFCKRKCFIKDELVGYGEDVTNCVYYEEET